MDHFHSLISLESELERFHSGSFQRLGFSFGLEEQFERDTSQRRSHRLWFEGLLAILAANACLLIDFIFVRDGAWQTVMLRTLLVTPVALLVNSLMRRNPRRSFREGSVAAGTTLIAYISLFAEGASTVTRVMFGFICVLIMMLFVNVMMRLRFFYAVSATLLMSAGGLWYLLHAAMLQTAEKVVCASLLAVAVTITLLANYSMERDERVNYLLGLRGETQGRELLEMNVVLQRLSQLDNLTGLPNRRSFEERFEQMWNDAELRRSPLSQIVIDVDHFKQINDVKGHLFGDKVLERIATLLPQGLRGETDFVARFGGEEFVVLLPETEAEQALSVAERIRSLVEVAGTPPHDVNTQSVLMWVTLSCGVSTCVPSPRMRRNDLLAAADRALYQAKADGRNRVKYLACQHLVAS